MAVYSMTGYATLQGGPAPAEGLQAPSVGIELRSVNSRFLDLSFKLGDELRGAEPALRDLLTTQLKRGKVEIRGWTETRHEHTLRAPQPAELQKLLSVQDGIRAWMPEAAVLSVSEVLQLAQRQAPTPSNLHDSLVKLAGQAISALKKARAREGQRLAGMLGGHVTQLRELAALAKPMVPALVEQQRTRFLDRWREALGQAGADAGTQAVQDRALAEATAFAIRIDVAEELTRLASHLDEIERLLATGGDIGKRMDFLIQELHREANTLGSKSSSLDLTRISVDMKVLIEQMREQVQNIE